MSMKHTNVNLHFLRYFFQRFRFVHPPSQIYVHVHISVQCATACVVLRLDLHILFHFIFHVGKWHHISAANCVFPQRSCASVVSMLSVTMSIYIKYNACGYWFIPFYWTICVHRMLSKRRPKEEKKIGMESNISEKRCDAWVVRQWQCRWLYR